MKDMEHVINAHYDGKAIIPDEPVELPIGRQLEIRIALAEAAPAPFADLLRFAADLQDAPTDFAAQHDHYLYGSPKR